MDKISNDQNPIGGFIGGEDENLEADTVTLDQTFMSNASQEGLNTSGPKNTPANALPVETRSNFD